MSDKQPMRNDLRDDRRHVLQDGATEAPFSGALLHNKETGTYHCAGCGHALFDSETKFDSGSGWPSFYDALPGTVEFVDDTSHGMMRTEIRCKNCGGHLGHVFSDGPRETTGMRYCVNSLALEFNNQKEKA